MNIIYQLILKFLLSEKYIIILIIILSLLINGLKVNVISYITANIIQNIQKKNSVDTYRFYYYFIIISVIFIILFSIYKYTQNNIGFHLKNWMKRELIKLTLIINNNNYSDVNFTKLYNPIQRTSGVFNVLFNCITSYIIPNITLIIIILCYFLYQNIYIGTIFLIGNLSIILYLYATIYFIIDKYKKHDDLLIDTELYMTEIFNNIEKIIFNGNSDLEIKKYTDKIDKSTNYAYNFNYILNYYYFIIYCILFITIFSIISYMIYLYYNNSISITIFITFFTILLLYRDMIIVSVLQMPDFLEFIIREQKYSNLFIDMNNIKDMDYNTIINEKYDKYDLDFNTIEFKNVSFKYKNSELYIFNDFNLELKMNNNILGVKGLSGIGKSTFVKLLIKIYKHSGTILIDGIDSKNIDNICLRKNIMYINQNPKLFDMKIIENIMYGCVDNEHCEEYFKEVMKFKKIRELFKNIDFYSKSAGSGGEHLSGGQRQVVNLINGLIQPSKIVILDEPTNALDIELKKEIISLIKYFKPFKKAIIIISHDDDIFPIFDETIDIKN